MISHLTYKDLNKTLVVPTHKNCSLFARMIIESPRRKGLVLKGTYSKLISTLAVTLQSRMEAANPIGGRYCNLDTPKIVKQL